MAGERAEQPLGGRPFWRGLYERDLDLVLLELIHSSEEFRARLASFCDEASSTEHAQAAFSGAWHSVLDDKGRESDLMAEWRWGDGRRFRLFIEDKIDAQFQPEQARDYVDRAAGCRVSDPRLVARTLLIAPLTYADVHKDAALFDRHLPIETVAEWLNEGVVGERGRYLSQMLRHMLRRWGQRQAAGGKPSFPVAYEIIREELPALAPELEISNPNPSSWVYFKFRGRRPGSYLRYRLADHWVELIFERKRVSEPSVAAALSEHPLSGASIDSRGDSEVAVWCATPEVDHAADAAEQREPIRQALAVVDSLRRWYLGNTEGLYA